MRVISLGSGSSGNAVVVQAGQTAVLVDAGFGPRTLASRLRAVGIAPGAISAVLLTHEHSDHTCGALKFAQQHRIPLVSDPRTLGALLAQPASVALTQTTAPERIELGVGGSLRLGALEVRSFPISHDAVAPCGFVLASAAWRVCVVTDTGMIAEPIIEALHEAHLVVVEANHDVTRLTNGPYPWHLKQRILSPTGHLSNAQTSAALIQALDDGPRWVWLAHLSRTNNTPDLARGAVRDQLRAAGLRHVVPVALPPEVGPVWDSADLLGNGGARQLTLPDARETVAALPARTPAALPMDA